jgi:CheY-like chemotaxis protein
MKELVQICSDVDESLRRPLPAVANSSAHRRIGYGKVRAMSASHVLLVDDDRALLQALSQVLPLRIPGLEVDIATSPTTALERIAVVDYDVVALDSTLPGISGLDLLTRIRALRPEAALLFLAGKGDPDLAAEAQRVGARDLIPKPIDLEVFCAAIEQALRLRQTNRQGKESLRTPAPVRDPAGPARRILIIEDDIDGREMLRLLLKSWGHEVEEAENGSQGIERALAERFDVALIDIGLPGLDGYQVAQQLRAAPAGRAVVLIALTGFGEPEDRRRALAAGFDVHITKPVDPSNLAALLEELPAKRI